MLIKNLNKIVNMPKIAKLLLVIVTFTVFLGFFSASNFILSSTEKAVYGTPLVSEAMDPKIVYAKENVLNTYQPTDKEYTIGRGRVVFYRGEGYQNKFKNLAIAFKYLDGYEIKPGEVFSYNKAIHLDDPNAVNNIYLEGLSTRSVMPAGGVCSGSTLLATAIRDSKLTFLNLAGREIWNPTPHEIYLPEYHRTFDIDGKKVPIVDATVSTYVGYGGVYYSAADVSFKNTTGYTLIIRVNGDWDKNQFTQGYPYERNVETITIDARINIKEAL